MEVGRQITLWFIICCCVNINYAEELADNAATTPPSVESSNRSELETGNLRGIIVAHKNGTKLKLKIHTKVFWENNKSIEKMTCAMPAVEKKGDKGDSGTPGIQGEMGEKGSNGTDGLNGSKGDSGTPGVKGEMGEKGSNGTDGLNGSKGDSGTPGVKGEMGEKGSNGTDGLNGSKGDSGTPGVKGEMGEKGSNGTDGLNGSKGDSGTPGVKGEMGEKGSNGTDGLNGSKGDSGTPGVKGEMGEKGSNGTDGLNGSKGDSGTPGVKGEMGERGVGLQGEKGEKGKCGDSDGKSMANFGQKENPAYSCYDIPDDGPFYVNKGKSFKVICEGYKTTIPDIPIISTFTNLEKNKKVWLSSKELDPEQFYGTAIPNLTYLVLTNVGFNLTLTYSDDVELLEILSWTGITKNISIPLSSGCTNNLQKNYLEITCSPPTYLPMDFFIEAKKENVSIVVKSLYFY